MFKDYYSILEISIDATQEQIKYAYKEQAKKWHPDKHRDMDTTKKMQDINEAFLILSDLEARKLYDIQYRLFKSIYLQREKEHINYSYDDFSINDDILQDWIIKARKQASDLAKEVKELSVVGVKASGSKMVELSIAFLIIGIIFFIIFSISQSQENKSTNNLTFQSNNYLYSNSNTIPKPNETNSDKKNNESPSLKKEIEWIKKDFEYFVFNIPSSFKEQRMGENQILFSSPDNELGFTVDIGDIPEGYDRNILIQDLIPSPYEFALNINKNNKQNFSDYYLLSYKFSPLGNMKALKVEQTSTLVSGKDIKMKNDSYFITGNGHFTCISFIYSDKYENNVRQLVESFNFSNANKANETLTSLEAKFIGKHLFGCSFIGYEKQYGKVDIEKRDNILYLKGKHQNKEKWVSIEGIINVINLREFNFTGTIKVYNPEEYNVKREGASPYCEWAGTAFFETPIENSAYWRNRTNCCYSYTGNMDIYFNEIGTRD